MSPQQVRPNTRRPIQKQETPSRGPLAYARQGLDVSGGSLQFRPSNCCTIITATAVLHNMCIVDNMALPVNTDYPPQQNTASADPCELIPDNNAVGLSVRSELINNVVS